ncbi:MAG: O-antigen ligase family protein [bacterium]|nr:O-antigen ligase family protein [bacterium]
MKVLRISDPDRITPLHVVLVCVVAATLAGSCLLTSGPHRDVLHDGAVEWGADSVLRAVVEVLNLGFAQTTAKGVAVKALVFSIGASAAMLTLALALGVRPRSGDEETGDDLAVVEEPQPGGDDTSTHPRKAHLATLVAAQLMILAYGLWSLLGSTWATAPDFALGGGVLLAISLVWTFALGLGLNRMAARVCCYALVIVGAATAGLAIWYHLERNPTLRASHPIGNPVFLAASLIPGIILAAGLAVAGLRRLIRDRHGPSAPAVIGLLAAAGLMLWAFAETRSRGPALGLVSGLIGLIVFSMQGRRRAVVGIVLAVVVGAALWVQFSRRNEYSATGRSATIRTRLLTWTYAVDLAVESPLLGRGQGTYVLAGDAQAGGADVLDDPLALDSRIAHAHNEWLEIWSDLGSIGLVFVIAGLLLTFRAGLGAVPGLPTPTLRWALISLMAALLGLVVEEMFSPGLRVAGLPTTYYTVIGLIWALSSMSRPRWRAAIEKSKPRRLTAGIVAMVIAGAALAAGVRDFLGARAYHDSSVQAGLQDWDRAVKSSDRARRLLLNPQRRLEATDRLCDTYLRAARAAQVETFRLLSEASQSDPPDERRLALSQESRRRAETNCQAGLAELGDLLKKSGVYRNAVEPATRQRTPHVWNTGVWEQGFYVIQASFARADSDTGAFEANIRAAVAALERELRRRPFDPALALTYVNVAGGLIEPAVVFDVLARPLRHAATPRPFVEFLRQAASRPGFDDLFANVFASARQVTPEQPPTEWADPWAPEKLRLAAVVLLIRNHFEQADNVYQQAADLYERLTESAPIGVASCYTRLAEARFFAHPETPARAIEAARRAIELAPDSETGRSLRQLATSQIVTYELAAGREATAREMVTELVGELTGDPGTAILDSEIGARYIELAHRSLMTGVEPLPPALPTWVQRAVMLSPQALLSRNDADMADLLRRAVAAGIDPQAVIRFLERVQIELPDSQPYQTLLAELRSPSSQPGTTQPTSTPADTDRE